jgi:hypothetical protein
MATPAGYVSQKGEDMTNKFIPMERLQSLYCIWIKTGNPRQPLECLWIDLEVRSFQVASFANSESIPAEADETEGKRTTCIREKASPTGQRIADLRARRHFSGLVKKRAGSLARILIALAVLLTSAWADVGGRISGVVTDPTAALVPGATITLTNANNRTRQTAATNDRGQYSFPSVSVGTYELEITAPGFQPYMRGGITIDVNTALQIDAVLQIEQNQQSVEVNDSVVTIQMSDTEIGQTIGRLIGAPHSLELDGRCDKSEPCLSSAKRSPISSPILRHPA